MTKILLIEDDEDLNEALSGVLRLKGYDVTCAFDGDQGLQAVKQSHPDLIITDIVMPVQDGIGFIMNIMKMKPSKPFKIIAISGGGRVAGGQYLRMAKSFGVDSVLAKPFTFPELQAQIDAMEL